MAWHAEAAAARTGHDGASPFAPAIYRVAGRRREAADVVTLALRPQEGRPPDFRPGQFNMLTAFGIGESAISISGGDWPETGGAATGGDGAAPDGTDRGDGAGWEGPGEAVQRAVASGGCILHTIRDVGAVTHALCSLPPGGAVGVRGPFGTGWPLEGLAGADVVAVAGGIGLAPLRGALDDLAGRLDRPGGPARLFVLVGARSPDQLIFADDLRRWASSGARVETTVDGAGPGWRGHVGVVTSLLPQVPFDPGRAAALVCGPEVMMRFTVRDLLDRGVGAGSVWISLERNMQCGVGLCGHCQLGPLLLCRDGPVVPYAGPAARLLTERER